ncbi:hypothetical protein L1987_24905 [Smallanthus sonchifolius]|uniref:Uncharacterized protein n=1 Tax=Smallanthus sonchifolius TaxID=185202 RepID=A0ACB9ILI4_9ASTR|nr:hypothetical protein L1987_24905 [Smallanthus sonchifolius]
MAARKGKNKMIYEGESSPAAANKRRRNEILNGENGVPFTNPITQFLSANILRQQRNFPPYTAVIGTNLQLSPPSPIQQEEEEAEDDGLVSWLIPQQNFIINYHINLMQQSVEEFWRRYLAGEVKKRKEIEAKLKEKEEQADRFRQMNHFYEKRTFHLEEMVQQQVAAERFYAAPAVAPEEEVQSCLVDLNSVQRTDVKCKNCRTRPATMLWLPCRHLCVCLVYLFGDCGICSAEDPRFLRRTQSVRTADLSDLGAGKEGWLDNPNLLCALDTDSLAIANRYFLLVLDWSHPSSPASFRVKIRPNLSPIEAEYISALEWLVFDDIRVIAIGTSCGYLLIYSLAGDLIHRQV